MKGYDWAAGGGASEKDMQRCLTPNKQHLILRNAKIAAGI